MKKLFDPSKWKFFQKKLKAAHIDATEKISNDIIREIFLMKSALIMRLAELQNKKLKINKFDRGELLSLPDVLKCVEDIYVSVIAAYGKREKELEAQDVF